MSPKDRPDVAATVPGRVAGAGARDLETAEAGGETLATTDAGGEQLGSAPTEAASGDDGEPASRIAPGTHVGRFVVLERVGAGGMGEVYAAYDPDLDRKVALKLLRGDIAGTTAIAEERLRREARTMARLVDRNLVTVHDVGVHQGRVFVAMEFVDGATLRTWAEGRRWDEILAAYLDAGRGLAAAHAAGVVHRDFKPDNVLVARDGRVAVTDFGIARTPGAAPDGDDPGDLADLRLTHTGALIGTPRYMAPEQLDGAAADVRSDQFSFCVALWEALYGEHPLAPPGAGFHALREAVARGELRPAPPSKVPPRVARALARGLSVDPARRWPALGELLAALDVLRPSRRWVWVALGGAAAVAAGGIAFGAWQAERRAPDDAAVCRGSEGLLDGTWDPARAAELRTAFAATHQPYAQAAFDGLRTHLDAWRAGWIDERTRACRATRVYREAPEAVLEARMRCFDDERTTVRTLVDVYATVTPEQLGNVAWATGKLPRPAECADRGALAAQVPPPPNPRAARLVHDLEPRVAAAEALMDAGDYHGALIRLGAASVPAAITGHAPLIARIELALGRAQNDLGKLDLAAAHFERALERADEARDDALRSEACTMEGEVAYYLSHYDDARRWLDRAAAIERRAGATDTTRAMLFQLRGLVDAELGAPAALDELHQAIALEQKSGPSLNTAQSYAALAGAEAAAGQDATAEADFRRSLATARSVAGGSHPFVAKILTNYGAYLLDHDRAAEALPLFQESLAIKAAVFGPDDPSLAFPIQNIAVVQRRTGHFAEAERSYARALALFEQRAQTAYAIPAALYGLASVRIRLGRPAEAVPLLERALALRAHAPHHEAGDGEKELQLARALWATGRRDLARRHGAAARAIFAEVGARRELAEAERWLAAPDRYAPQFDF